MLIIHVTLLMSGDTKTMEVRVARNTSVHLCLMQARSQSLDFDLENSRIYLSSPTLREIRQSELASTPVKEHCSVIIRPQSLDKSSTVVEID